jgi:hypothetical protein
MENIILQILLWLVISLISFGIVSYMVFTCPEFEEREDGSMIRVE